MRLGLDFLLLVKSIGVAWVRFLLLLEARHGLRILPWHDRWRVFCPQDSSRRHGILEIISENTSFEAESTPSQEQRKSSDEDILAVELDPSLSIPLDSALETSPEPRVLEKEEIQTPELHFKFEDDLS